MADAAQRGGRTRRTVLRAVFGLGMLGGTATALAPVVRAGREARGTEADPRALGEQGPGAEGPPADGPLPGVVEETYKGRRIRVGTTAGDDASFAAAASVPGVYAPTPSHDIQIDGRPLHVMRRADGSYVSVVNHYESFPTRLAVARAAVDDLRGAQLSRSGPMLHHA